MEEKQSNQVPVKYKGDDGEEQEMYLYTEESQHTHIHLLDQNKTLDMHIKNLSL